jgi:hypothetical protein
MGLDISAYSRVVPITGEMMDAWRHPEVYVNPDFKERADGLENGIYRRLEGSKEHNFRAGSYSGYNWWRDELANMARPPAFEELVNFSDCEGTIGHLTSAKLAADFAAHQEKADARRDDGTMFYQKYCDWRKACEIASDNGFLSFH